MFRNTKFSLEIAERAAELISLGQVTDLITNYRLHDKIGTCTRLHRVLSVYFMMRFRSKMFRKQRQITLQINYIHHSTSKLYFLYNGFAQRETLIVTGDNSYIAGHIIAIALDKAYNFRGTVRSEYSVAK